MMRARTGLVVLVSIACNFDSESPGDSAATIASGSSGESTDSTLAAESSAASDSSGAGFDGPAQRRLDLGAEAAALGGSPLLVILGQGRIEYDRVLPDGSDLAFHDPADLDTPLLHEIEHWTLGGASYVWVRLPDPVPDHLVMVYGTGTPTEPADAVQVWGDDFAAVWHFAEDPSDGVLDSTAHDHDGRLLAPLPAAHAAGVVGNALTLDGADSHVEVADGGPELGDAVTLEAWVRVDVVDPSAARFVVLKQDAYHVLAMRQMLAQPRVGLRLADDALLEAGPAFTLPTAWTYVAATWEGGGALKVFVDGEQVDTDAADGMALAQPDAPLLLGRRLAGSIDEVRISTVARSPAWIAAQHAAMRGMLVEFGEPEPL